MSGAVGLVILLWVMGLWCLAGAVFNWPWFLNYWDNLLRISFKQEPGWHGKRIFWLLGRDRGVMRGSYWNNRIADSVLFTSRDAFYSCCHNSFLSSKGSRLRSEGGRVVQFSCWLESERKYMKCAIFWLGLVPFSLATIAWPLAGRVDALPDHPKEVQYSTVMPYSPTVGGVVATMALRVVLEDDAPSYGIA